MMIRSNNIKVKKYSLEVRFKIFIKKNFKADAIIVKLKAFNSRLSIYNEYFYYWPILNKIFLMNKTSKNRSNNIFISLLNSLGSVPWYYYVMGASIRLIYKYFSNS